MTIDDLLAAPHPKYGPQAFRKELKEEDTPEIGVEWNGRSLTRRETYCLLTHIFLVDCRAAIPASWHDAIGLALLDLAERGDVPWNPDLLISRMAGPRTMLEVKHRLGTGRMKGTILFYLLEPMLADDWVLNLPLFAQALYVSRELNSYFAPPIETRLEALRKQQAIAPDTWELLMIPQSQFSPERIEKSRAKWAEKLEELMRRGVRFSAGDFRLLVNHPMHAGNLAGLLLLVHREESSRTELWPCALADDETVSIAHALFLNPKERDMWTARMARENRVPPFDQWKGAGRTPHIDLEGIGANPSELMLHLEARGWRRGRTGADGVIRSHWKAFPDMSLRVVVEYPGIPTKYGGHWSFQVIESCRFEQELSGEPLEVEKASPIAVSEVMDDLDGLRQ
jgi:hypothetical protein